jgi:hypothetical protein
MNEYDSEVTHPGNRINTSKTTALRANLAIRHRQVEMYEVRLLAPASNMKPEAPYSIPHATIDCVMATIACMVVLVLCPISFVAGRNRQWLLQPQRTADSECQSPTRLHSGAP